MPTAQNQRQLEYYHYYRASQRRVQQWVQKTSRELEVASTAAGGRYSDLPLEGTGSGSGLPELEGESRRRRRSSSSSSLAKRQQIHDQIHNAKSPGPSSRSRSTQKKKKKPNDVRAHDTRSQKLYSSDALPISSLLPFGLLLFFFALTSPSVATLFSATILLANYFYGALR